LFLVAEIYSGVYDGQLLGEGVAGIVRRIRHRTTGVEYACKELDISGIDSEAGLRQLRDEISIMCQLDHPNIVRIE
jgi:calcium-dependent protein kinase